MQYEPLTLQRAQAIVEHAENEYATGRQFRHTFTPFEAGGASSPQEALLSLYIVIAQRFSSVCQSGSSAALKMFDDYVASSRLISIDLFLESTEIEPTAASLNPETTARLKSWVTLDSFVSFLRTLRPSSPDYWPQVYERLGLASPVPSASIQVETSVETKPLRNIKQVFSHLEKTKDKSNGPEFGTILIVCFFNLLAFYLLWHFWKNN